MPRINHNIPSLMTTNALMNTEARLSKTIEQLSTGQRINYAYDDAAGYSVSEQMRSEIQGIKVGNQNIQNGQSLVDIAHGAMTEIEQILNRMRDLSVQAANGSYTDEDREFNQQEVDALMDEIDRIAQGTEYNGTPLLNGTAPWGSVQGGKLHIGSGNDSNADILRLRIEPMLVEDPINNPGVGLNLNGLNIDNQDDAKTAIGRIDDVIHTINKGLADLGAYANRLNHALENQKNVELNITAAESVIRDTDIATATAEYTKLQVLQKAAVSVLAQANSFPKDILSLLKIG